MRRRMHDDPRRIFIKDGEIELNAGRKTVTLTVANTGDRPIQVGSHYHFFETNPALNFDRKKARGMRLDIAAGTAVRFEPGQTREVDAVAARRQRVTRLRLPRRGDGEALSVQVGAMPCHTIKRSAYADMFGPTTGDRVRLADTDLIIEVEKDFTIYGEEVKFGGGKVIRDGMGQSQVTNKQGRGRHRHHQRADPRPLGHRQGRRRPSRTATSPPSARPAIPTSSPASPSSSARAPRSSPARARSSPPAASTATSISSARSRSTTR